MQLGLICPGPGLLHFGIAEHRRTIGWYGILPISRAGKPLAYAARRTDSAEAARAVLTASKIKGLPSIVSHLALYDQTLDEAFSLQLLTHHSDVKGQGSRRRRHIILLTC